MSYYTNNSALLFRKASRFEQLLTLSDIEEMTPFEREVYLIQIENKVKEDNKKLQQGGK